MLINFQSNETATMVSIYIFNVANINRTQIYQIIIDSVQTHIMYDITFTKYFIYKTRELVKSDSICILHKIYSSLV